MLKDEIKKKKLKKEEKIEAIKLTRQTRGPGH
jgi:hypothetical protein